MINSKAKYTFISGLFMFANAIGTKAFTPAASSGQHSSSDKQPNIVFILADDLGVECLSAYGGTSHKTPNIDKLATQGMRFANCFSNPFCSPSRASLLTGRYPFMNGLKEVLFDARAQANTYLHIEQTQFCPSVEEGRICNVHLRQMASFLPV